jgi:long-subunit acyl-CoA synthetase (AMP-forming)
MEMARTVIQVLDETAKRYPTRSAMKVKRDGIWRTTTWAEYRDRARLVGRALIELGLPAGKGVSIIGFNSPEWVLADVGAILAGGMPAGVYTTSSPEQCQYIAHHSESAVVFTEDAKQTAKFLQVRARLPHLKKIVQWTGSHDDPLVMPWDALLDLGKRVPESALEARITAQDPGDVATLIYTSGTTGDPKAVMITHDNVVFTAEVSQRTIGFTEDEVTISYLPLSHVAEQMMTIHGPMMSGGTVYFAESLEKLGDNLREVRPTVFVAVPRVWEKMQAKIQAAGASSPPLRKKIAAWARKVGLEGGYALQRGGKKPLLFPVADKIVFSKVRARLGLDRCRVCVTSAAPIARDTLEFFLSLGIPICEVYGMSECTGPTTFSTPERYKTGKAGWVMPGVEVKVAADGEICMRGRHVFKGYLKNDAATREALDEEGWLHSGDIGEIDRDGFVQVTDRKKELLITAGGENIAPQMLEGHLKAIPAVAQAVVIGDRKKFLVALLTLDPEKIADEARASGSDARDMIGAARCPKMRAHVERQVATINEKLARVQTIKRIAILPNELTIDGGELTPTMKLRRKVINSKYEDVIAGLYAGDDERAPQAAATV